MTYNGGMGRWIDDDTRAWDRCQSRFCSGMRQPLRWDGTRRPSYALSEIYFCPTCRRITR